MSQELVTYIVLGSHSRLARLKKFKVENDEECIFLSFNDYASLVQTLDNVIADSSGSIIVLLPPSSIPKKKNRISLKKMAMINYPVWGWFDLPNSEYKVSSNLKKLNTFIRTTPSIEQGIYFTKDLYFSIGGMGKFKADYFTEISKRLYSRLDPQKPLAPLTSRSSSKVSLL
ncbi:hypothetical protein OAL98_01140 [Gammaproteobacteria bacterium]|nr:hypothetical protein [Gammaproteobacteria bacterium]